MLVVIAFRLPSGFTDGNLIVLGQVTWALSQQGLQQKRLVVGLYYANNISFDENM